MLHIEDLVKRYGDTVAVDHLSLDIKEGEVFGLLGPNGSGKTTTINCVLSLLKYDRGKISLFGREMSPTAYDLKRRIGVVFQDVAVFEKLNVRENIDYFCSLYVDDKEKRKEYTEEALDFAGLTDYAKKRPNQLSGGLLRRLNIACGIAHKPDLIFLDEPTVAVDPQSRNKILDSILEMNKNGSTIIYTSHYMEEVEQICSRIAILDKGRVVAEGTSDELRKMIRTGETISVESIILTPDRLATLRSMKNVFSVSYDEETLIIKYNESDNNLLGLLKYLESENIGFADIHSKLPTLNDVFLEITGKELRD